MTDGGEAWIALSRGGAGPRSREHWAHEQELIAPGLQSVLQWAELTVASASGACVTDVDGNVFIDLFGGSGVNSIGHSHPVLVDALAQQLQSWMVGAFGSTARLELLERLRRVLPAGLDRVQLYTSGAEAVEAALRLAKSFTGKYEFLSFWNGFHGKTLGASGLTSGARHKLGPMPTGFFSAPFANCYRCPLLLRHPECGLACVDLARDVIREQSVGALAAIVVEPVQGRAGNVAPPPGYLGALRSLADEFDALLIVDEMISGLGRTGRFLASDGEGVMPDIAVLGKGLGGGHPISAVASCEEIMQARPFSDPSASSSSYGGFPMACAAGAATLRVLEEERLIEHAESLGAELLARLRRLEETAANVGRVHGIGLMIGIELVTDKVTKMPVSRDVIRAVFLELLDQGVLVMVGGNCLRLYPPLSIDAATAHRSAEIIEDVLTAGRWTLGESNGPVIR